MDRKVALVTGASRGIGRAIAIQLAKDGYAVAINFRSNESEAVKTGTYIKDIRGPDHPFQLCQFDVADASAIQSGIARIQKNLGPVGILVNNAGVAINNLLPRLKLEEIQATIQTNLIGSILTTQACTRGMMKARWGRIINISSVAGQVGNAGQSIYCAAKAGIVGFTKSMAKELASRNITVNAISPGMIESEMTDALSDAQRDMILSHIPAKKYGNPEDVAILASFLCRDDACYITGQNMGVNGGMYG